MGIEVARFPPPLFENLTLKAAHTHVILVRGEAEGARREERQHGTQNNYTCQRFWKEKGIPGRLVYHKAMLPRTVHL